MNALWPWQWRSRTWWLPVTVLLVRISPGTRALDDDNLAGALKAVRDQVATELGVDDGDSESVRFVYAQARGPWAVRISIEERR